MKEGGAGRVGVSPRETRSAAGHLRQGNQGLWEGGGWRQAWGRNGNKNLPKKRSCEEASPTPALAELAAGKKPHFQW